MHSTGPEQGGRSCSRTAAPRGGANQVIEHVANPLRFVAVACRVLRPGGVLATTPNVRYANNVVRVVIGGRGPMTDGAALRTPQVWDDDDVHFFPARDLEWLARAGGFSRVRTTALSSPTAKGGGPRRALDKLSSPEIVTGFLGGNVTAVSWK